MFHLVAHSVPGRLLFCTWTEAAELWHRLSALQPGVVALHLMPDHIHLQHERDCHDSLLRILRAYARWLNARRGITGPLWHPIPPAHPLRTRDKQRRSERYILLNCCRAHLATDPLEWPFSSHRDAVGLAMSPIRPHVHDAARYHRWVSSDASVHPSGTELPVAPYAAWERDDALVVVEAAVSALTRTTLRCLRTRGAPRTLLLRCARALTKANVGEISAAYQVSRRTVSRISGSDPTECAWSSE